MAKKLKKKINFGKDREIKRSVELMSLSRPHSTIEIGQNTEKSPGELMNLGVTQTPVTSTS